MAEFREHASLAAFWDGTVLVPEPAAVGADATVWFVVPPHPDLPNAPQYWEAINASRLSENTFVIRGCPALVARVAFGDVVRVVASGEGALVVTGIAERGGYDSARLWFGNGGDSWRVPTEVLAADGCIVDVYSERLVGIAWPARHGIQKSLERMQSEGLFEYATA